MSRIRSKSEICIGCRLCEVWCLVEHSKSKNIIKAYLYEKDRPSPRVKVEERGHVSFALQCRHCEEADCIPVCVSGALYRSYDKELVIHDAAKCIGCWSCVLACPYGAIIRDEIHGKALKCDLCVGKDMPVCVEKCPNNALEVEQKVWSAST